MPKQNPTWLENYSNLPSIGETSYSRMPSTQHGPLQHGPVAATTAQYYSSNALDRELDAIELKGSMMTLADKERYHELLKKISELRGPAPLGQSRSTSDFIGANGFARPAKDKQLRNPPISNNGNGIEPQHRVSKPDYTLPFMNEMATKLESKKQQQQRLATLPKPDSIPTTSTTTSTTSFSTLIQRPQISQTEKLIDDVTQQIERINATPLTPSTPSTSAIGGGLPRPAMRDSSVSPEDRSKKRVQFSDRIEDVKENDDHEVDEDDDNDDDKIEPLTVGKHEVYNDPRQRRLNEIQQKSIKPAVDGAHLAFRDKMKMFAKQANETTPKVENRYKSSSAQREIEQASDSA
uniref:Uncharacterized protein n=1 Tax=Panagrolaimus sp. ES5 TaxID=591445 RepID=A0AC34FMT2_9BILA